MITVRLIEGRYTPLVLCDHCGRRITEPGLAAVAYDLRGTADRQPFFAHKGRCHDAIDEAIETDGGMAGWGEFRRWMVDLLHNAGLHGDELDSAVEHAAAFHELGL